MSAISTVAFCLTCMNRTAMRARVATQITNLLHSFYCCFIIIKFWAESVALALHWKAELYTECEGGSFVPTSVWQRFSEILQTSIQIGLHKTKKQHNLYGLSWTNETSTPCSLTIHLSGNFVQLPGVMYSGQNRFKYSLLQILYTIKVFGIFLIKLN